MSVPDTSEPPATPQPTVRKSIFDNPGVLNLTPRQANHVLASLLAFLEHHQPHVGRVLLGVEEGAWTAKDIRRLESLLVKEIEAPGIVRDYLRVLRKATAFWGLREGLKLELPRIPLLTPTPKNPFRGNLPRALARYAAWKAVLDSWLRKAEANRKLQNRSDPAWAIEQVIVSAILYGGLVNMASVLALVRAIPDLTNRVVVTEGRVHVELSLPWRGIPEMESRRWQPDALTTTLLANTPVNATADLLAPDREQIGEKCAPVEDRTVARRLGGALQEMLKQDPAHQRTELGGIYALLRAAQVVAHLEMPGIVASYAARNLVYHSLRRNTLQRISKDARMHGTDGLERQEAEPNPQSVHGKLDSEDLEPEWFRTLRTSMRGKDTNKVRMELARLGTDTASSPFLRRMADFGDSMLAVRTVSGKMLSVHAARDLVLPVARNLGRFAEDADSASLSTASLEMLYVQAIESTGPVGEANANRMNLARALFEFHRYMMACHSKEPIEGHGSDLLIGPQELVAVDANLLTLGEYRTTLRSVDEEWPATDAPERKQIARVLVILGFRCGLRRREALHMLVRDMLLDGPAELLVRPSEIRELKSNNALRRLPLAVLLTQEELNEVIAWWDYRVNNQKAKSTDCLFGNVREGLKVIPQSIFQQINSILHKITHDDTFHYHHLRHSFATWTFLRLMLADWNPLPDLFPHLPETTAWLREGPAFRQALYGHSCPTRKHGYLLAGLLGHGSPATSMENYVHLLDWMLAACLERSSAMSPDRTLVAIASGRPRSTLERWKSEAAGRPLHAIATRLWIGRFPAISGKTIPRSQRNLADDSNIQVPTLHDRLDWVDRAWDFLYTAETSGRPLEELACRFQLEDDQAEDMLDRARALRAMKSGNGSSRHAMKTWIPDRQNPEDERSLACPFRPVHALNREIVAKFSTTLQQLANRDLSLAQNALDLYTQRVWSSDKLVLFHDPEKDFSKAKVYIEFLVSLGILSRDICFISFDRSQRSRSRAQWKNQLGLNQRHHFEIRNAPNKESKAAKSWLGIEPQFHLGPATNRDKNPGSLGFHFLMLMGHIVYGGR